MFSLNSNGRCEIKKFDNKNDSVSTWIDDDNNFGSCGLSGCHYDIGEIDKNESRVNPNVSNYFKVDDPKIFTGSNKFTTKRVIVIEMN